MSVISHCSAQSHRDDYVRQLIQHLGHDRVHRYGKCGDRTLPERPISNAARLIAKYKLYVLAPPHIHPDIRDDTDENPPSYLSFENTIQEGYVTEKLLVILNLPTVPVYYGYPQVPNITTTPSFIRASDFSSPSDLAKYLLYLDEHHQAYEEFSSWRNSANPFDDFYLSLVRDRVAGPEEVQANENTQRSKVSDPELSFEYLQRRAQCCRLCDTREVRKAKATRTRVVSERWRKDKISKHFFNNNL